MYEVCIIQDSFCWVVLKAECVSVEQLDFPKEELNQTQSHQDSQALEPFVLKRFKWNSSPQPNKKALLQILHRHLFRKTG